MRKYVTELRKGDQFLWGGEEPATVVADPHDRGLFVEVEVHDDTYGTDVWVFSRNVQVQTR